MLQTLNFWTWGVSHRESHRPQEWKGSVRRSSGSTAHVTVCVAGGVARCAGVLLGLCRCCGWSAGYRDKHMRRTVWDDTQATMIHKCVMNGTRYAMYAGTRLSCSLMSCLSTMSPVRVRACCCGGAVSNACMQMATGNLQTLGLRTSDNAGSAGGAGCPKAAKTCTDVLTVATSYAVQVDGYSLILQLVVLLVQDLTTAR